MRIVHSHLHIDAAKKYIAIGKWDGLHLGHQQLIRTLVKKARANNGKSIVIGFDRHPLALFKPGREPLQIQSIEERSLWLKELGVDYYLVLPFTKKLASYSPTHFVKQMLLKELQVHDITIGYNFRFGKGAQGTIALLKELCLQQNVNVQVIPPVYINGEIVSSTLIRHYYKQGQMEKVEALLGYPAKIIGNVKRVAHSKNIYELQVDAKRQLPCEGRYDIQLASSLPSLQKGTLHVFEEDGQTQCTLFLSDNTTNLENQMVYMQIEQKHRYHLIWREQNVYNI